MQKVLVSAGLVVLLGACGSMNVFKWTDEAAYDLEPSYCYQSIGKIECYAKPYHRDERRLVNYFGPSPSRFIKPPAPEKAPHAPPVMINYWVKDAEPMPRAAVPGAGTAAVQQMEIPPLGGKKRGHKHPAK